MSESPLIGRVLSDTAHEVRGAAAATTAWVDVLAGARDEAGRERAIAELRRSLTRAVKLASDLSDAAVLLEGRAATADGTIDLVAVIAGVAGRLEPEARARRVELRVSLPAGLTRPHVGDAEVWQRIVDRVVAAALVHTPRGKALEVTVAVPGGAGPELTMPCGSLELPAPEALLDAWREWPRGGAAFPFGLVLARGQLARAGGRLEVRGDPPGRTLVALMP